MELGGVHIGEASYCLLASAPLRLLTPDLMSPGRRRYEF